MSRITFTQPTVNFAANAIAVQPPVDATRDLWAFFGGSAAASPNMVTNTPLDVVGTPTWSSNFVTVTPDTHYLVPTGLLDIADSTVFAIIRTSQIGGNFSPFWSAYVGGVGLMMALGDNEIRFHATGFGAATNLSVAGNYGSNWALWSFRMDSGAANPTTWKCHTHNQTGTYGTASASRSSLGAQMRVGGFTLSTASFPCDVAFIGRSASALDATQTDLNALSITKSAQRRGIIV